MATKFDNTYTIFRGKDPDFYDFEITSDINPNIELIMKAGAISATIYNANTRQEYPAGKHRLKKDFYTIIVEKIEAVTDPANPPSITLNY
jgi:hypothetical protein